MNNQKKSDFVINQLKNLLIALDINITDCKYILKNDIEYVRVTYQNGSSKDICIDGDSLIAIVSDVIKKVV